MGRFGNTETFNNSNDLYRDKFKDKQLKYIEQYKTTTFNQITEEMLEDVRFFNYAWSVGDTWQYVADQFYDSPKEWKVLALFNKLPTELHISVGDIIRLPYSLDELKSAILG